MLRRSLSHFVALASERDVSRAAERCNVRPPAILTSIRGLEAYLEAPLVDQESGPLRLTTQGERALSWAQKILGDYESMCSGLATMRQKTQGIGPLRKERCQRR